MKHKKFLNKINKFHKKLYKKFLNKNNKIFNKINQILKKIFKYQIFMKYYKIKSLIVKLK